MEPAATSRIYLMMDGVDHIDAEEQLPTILESLRAAFPDLTIRHASWPEFLRAYQAENPALEELSGPLYQIGQHGMNNRVLKNVLSSVVHNKQNNDACERLLTGTAEPLLAFLRAEGDAAATENDVGQREDFLRPRLENPDSEPSARLHLRLFRHRCPRGYGVPFPPGQGHWRAPL